MQTAGRAPKLDAISNDMEFMRDPQESEYPFWDQVPGLFYKGRSQEKTPLQRLEFFLLLSPLI